jgi:integrase/recombinase XerC
MLNEGADLNAIKEVLGHSSLSSTQVYTSNSVERLKKIYEQAHPRGNKDGG